MKLTKKLLPALGMLALSACMMVTSTFAWFSMNDNVTATDMSVTAVGEQVYLQIISGNVKSNFKDGDSTQTTAVASNKSGNLLPSAVKADSTNWGAYDGGSDYVWAKATGTDPNTSDKTGAYSLAVHTTETKYYLENFFMIRLDPYAGATNASGALRVGGVNFVEGETVDALGQSVCVLVVCGENSQLFTYNGSKFVQDGESDPYLDASEFGEEGNEEYLFDNNEGVEVKVYVFFNGDHANCTLANLAEANNKGLNNYAVTVSFTVAKPQNN